MDPFGRCRQMWFAERLPCDGDKRDDAGNESDADEDICSPICSTGPCAKVLSSVASVMFVELELTVEGRELVVARRASDVSDGVSQGVFHPPRA